VAKDLPDVVVIDGMCCDLAELDHVERTTLAHPQLAVVLMCAQQSPEFLIKAMRVGVREVLPSPAPSATLLAAMGRLDARLHGLRPDVRGQLLAFMPCKGGSGATFIASNLGYQLAAEGRSVLLIDLNLQFGDALSLVHEQAPAFTLADVARDIRRLDAAFLSACAVKVTAHYSVLAAPQDFGQAVEIEPEQVDAIVKLALQHHDFVLLDLGRNLDHMNIKALDRADHIFMVLQAGLPWLRQAKRLQLLLRSLDYPADKVDWIVNRFEKSADIGLEEIGRTLGTARVRTVVNCYRDVKTAVNHGTALVEVLRSSAVTRSLAELALSLDPRQEEQRSLLGRLFRRA
jgi:pilus assembly protein CpaE